MVSTAAFHARVRGSVPGLGGLKETKMFLPHPRVKVSTVGSLRDREVAYSASDRQGSNFESCVWRTVSSQSSHHPQEVLLAQFSLYVHKGGLKPDSFHFISFLPCLLMNICVIRLVYNNNKIRFKKRHMRQGGNNCPMKNIDGFYFNNLMYNLKYINISFFSEIHVFLLLEFDIFIRYRYAATIELRKII